MSSRARVALAGLTMVAGWVLAGCGDDTGAGDGRGSRIDGDYVSNGAPDPPFPDGSEPIRLTLRGGEISFTATCNHFSGQAAWDDGVLRTGTLGGTEMGCPRLRLQQDEWMVDFFGSAPEIELDGTDLRLRSAAGTVRFVPADEVPSGDPGDVSDLIGTEWRLTGIGERDGDAVGMMIVPRHIEASIQIEDGRTVVRMGCNSGEGRATVTGDTITFRRMETTVMGCVGTAAEIERAVGHVLSGTASWSISGDELRLSTRGGRRELVYRR